LESLYERPDEVRQKVFGREQNEAKRGLDPEIAAVQNVLRLAASLSNSKVVEQSIEYEETWSKISTLFNNIGDYRGTISKYIKETNSKTLYLLIDDFYQIDLFHQPLVADYLKRLFSKIPCYIKIATVRNRTLLFVKDNLTEAGLQAVHDYTGIDLDFSLDDFRRARSFFSGILQNVCEGRLDPATLFESEHIDAMDILTEAAGGNPRDFINLLRNILSAKLLARTRPLITHFDIRSAILDYYKAVKNETATTYRNFAAQDFLLREITSLCQEKNDIGFYVSKEDMKAYPAVSSLIGQLTDSRFIHLLTQTYVPPISQDNPAQVFILSMGIYSEYSPDKLLNLISRQSDKKPYPKFSPVQLSNQITQMAPELVLIGKSTEDSN
jgi:hypothetical protein